MEGDGMSKREVREQATTQAAADGKLPRFGDLIEAGGNLVGFFVRSVRIPGGRPGAGPWFQLTDGRGLFWLADPETVTIAARQRLSLAQLGLLIAAHSRRAPDLVIGPPVLRGDAPEDGDLAHWSPAMDAEARDLLDRKPPLLRMDETGETFLTPAGRAAVQLMSEIEQSTIALRFVGDVRQAAAQIMRKEGSGHGN
jgi:hypothetical protein